MFLFRSCFAEFTPYQSGKLLFDGEAKIFLDTNENPFDTGKNRYPSSALLSLRTQIAVQKNKQFFATLSAENIVLGNGSDELIDLLVRLFCEPKEDSILITPPTFGMYSVAAHLNQISIIEVPLSEDFSFPKDAVLDEIVDKNLKMVFLCSPNNPTGNAISSADIISILQTGVLTVIDEAYIDFCSEKSLLSKLFDFPNAIFLHTFSKMWGLAGMRCGVMMAHHEIIQKIMAIKMPYNINVATEHAISTTLENADAVFLQRDVIVQERMRMPDEYKKCSCVDTVFPSDANFLLIRFVDAKKVYSALLNAGIIVRDFSSKKRLENCLRITIGTPEENIQVLSLLQSL